MNNVPPRTRDRLGRALDSGPVYATAAAVIVLLLALFYAVLSVNMDAIDAKTVELKQHPYTVTVAAGRAETLLMQVRTLDDRLVFACSPETLASVQSEYAVIDDQLQTALAAIAGRCRSNPELAKSLLKKYDTFREQQHQLVALGTNGAGDEAVAAFLASAIDPRIDAMLDDNATILAASSQSFDQLYETVEETRTNTMFMSTVLMVAVVVALFLFFLVIRRKNRLQNELQLNLECALEKAQEASLAKSRFLSRVSHDIRTPLTAIIGLTDIASEHADDPMRVKQSLAKVRLSSHHLLNLVNDVLDMSKIENGQIDLGCEPFDVRAVVETLVSIVHPQADTKSLRFAVERIDIEDGLVLGDEMRVSQILINLLGNAVKYTEPGGLVTLSVDEVPQEGTPSIARDGARVRTIRFIVEDDGIGMSKEFLSRVFVPFEREDVPARLAVEGTGLGMAIAKNLVDLMGGSIEVESQRHRGTRFTLTLPFEACESDTCTKLPAAMVSAPTVPDEPADPVDAAEEQDGETWSNVHVLLAEDNLIVGEIAEEFIRATGATLDRAWNGAEAVELLQTAPADRYDLVFMDIQMPCMDGLEAARAMVTWCERSGRVRPPIIAMTANAYVEDRQRAFEAGMDGFAVKPIGESEIRHLFQSYLAADAARAGTDGDK